MLRVIGKCHHPAHYGDFFTRCRLILEEKTNQSQLRQQWLTFDCKSCADIWLSLEQQVPFNHPSSSAYEYAILGFRINLKLTCFLSVPLKDFAPKYRRVDPESITQYLVHEESWIRKEKNEEKLCISLTFQKSIHKQVQVPPKLISKARNGELDKKCLLV